MKLLVAGKFASGVSVVALSIALSGGAFAQDSATSTGGATVLDQIVVTGEKVSRTLRDTASSVAVITSEDIEERVDAAHVNDLLNGIPNVLLPDTVSAPVIRGVDGQGANFGSGAFFGGTVPRARINLDGHNLSYYETVFGATSIWDVESIEVYRGPQTTAQGANSIAGAIIVDTKDPTFTPEIAAQLQYGSRNRKRASLAVSGPFNDELAGRLAIDYAGRNTFIDYTNPLFSPGGELDFESLDLRMKLLWEPTEVPGLSAKLTYAHKNTNRPTSEAAGMPYADLQSGTLSMPTYDGRTNIGVFDVSYDFGNDVVVSNQFQYSQGRFKRLAQPASNGGATMDYTDVSNEARVNFGTDESEFSGVVGIYYNNVESHDMLNVRGISDFDDSKDSFGLFSEVTWRFAESWRLTGGARYQYDSVKRYGTSNYAPGQVLDFDESFDAFLPRIALAYDVNEDLTVGGLISRGYNPGGAGLRFVTGDYYTFEAETLWNYELFARASLLDERMHLNANLFYTDHKNSQRVVPDYLNGVLFGSVVLNAEKATSYGLEISGDYRVLDNLLLRGSAGLMHSEITEFTDPAGAINAGNEFGRAPGYMFSIGADWNITEQVMLSGEVRHTDGYYSTDNNDPAYYVDSFTVANARLTYSPKENFELYGYVNNIFDERAPTWKYDDRTAGGIVASMLEPREFGVGLKVRY